MIDTQAKDGPDRACSGFTPDEQEALREAARILVEQRGLIVQVTGLFGSGVEWVGSWSASLGSRRFGPNWQERVRAIAELTLWKSHGLATIGLDPRRAEAPRLRLNTVVSSLSGAATGFLGFPAIALDIPVCTLLIMRAIAQVARAHGEDIASDDTRHACLQVLAFGTPAVPDEAVEIGYWSARAALTHLALEVLIRRVAARFGVVVSEKLLAQAVPVAGAVAGAGLNYVFMTYYQQMARVHFTLRRMERRTGNAGAVRACFDRFVEEARAQRGITAPPRDRTVRQLPRTTPPQPDLLHGR